MLGDEDLQLHLDSDLIEGRGRFLFRSVGAGRAIMGAELIFPWIEGLFRRPLGGIVARHSLVSHGITYQ